MRDLSDTRKSHWEKVYSTKSHTDVSWYQPVPSMSLELIRSTGASLSAPILDVGCGASTLVDHLLDDGHEDISVLDIAAGAFEQSRTRLGDVANDVTWIESDVTEFAAERRYSIWHDRAVFHFLTDAADRKRYLKVLRNALAPQGHLVLATFGPEGPMRCSGLEIRRYSTDLLQTFLGPDFELLAQSIEIHETPTCSTQQFLYSLWQLRN